MNKSRNKLRILENADDRIVERLSRGYVAMDEKQKERIYAISERKLKSMKREPEDVKTTVNRIGIASDIDRVELKDRGKWYRPVRTAIACAVAVTVIVGGVFLANNFSESEPEVSGTTLESDSAEISNEGNSSLSDKGITSEAETIGSNVSSSEKFYGAEKNSDTELTDGEDILVSSARTNTEIEIKNSEAEDLNAQTSHSIDYGEESRAEDVTAQTSQSTDNGKAGSTESKSGESSQAHIGDINPDKLPLIPDEFKDSDYYSEEDEPLSTSEYGKATENNVLSISADMTYVEVVKLLGTPETLGITHGYLQYTIETANGPELLMIHYDNELEPIGVDGSVLLENCVPYSDLEADYANLTFEGFVVADGVITRVTCPQYPQLGCADLSFSAYQSSVVDLKVGDRVKITYFNEVLECYPCIIRVQDIYLVE